MKFFQLLRNIIMIPFLLIFLIVFGVLALIIAIPVLLIITIVQGIKKLFQRKNTRYKIKVKKKKK